MKWISLLLTLFSVAPVAARDPADDVFKVFKLTLEKTEVLGGEKNYFVQLPFDPSLERSAMQIQMAIVERNGCKPFSITSPKEKVRIHVKTMRSGGACTLKEEILKP